MTTNPNILYITDLYYQANNRLYYTEDLFVTGQLKDAFNIFICHPLHSLHFEDKVDLVVIRNSGPTIYYQESYKAFFKRANENKICTYNSLNGRGDMLGKQYLVTLTDEGFPVIPTIDDVKDIRRFPEAEKYIIKPKEGADSIGMKAISKKDVASIVLNSEILQPFINFTNELSFYFIDGTFQYALYAPDKSQRWKLEMYIPTKDDLAFAEAFVQWNTMSHGIQRVDACRLEDESLLLVELEDLNPFLSLDLLDEHTRESFVKNFSNSLLEVIDKKAKQKSALVL